MSIQSYRDLTIWQDAITLAADLYRTTSKFPREEIYGLTAQIRRSAGPSAMFAATAQSESIGKRIRSLIRSLQEKVAPEG